MTFAELSEAWNRLRNAALGRGTAPLVSADLAQRVGVAYEAWREYLARQGALEELAPSLVASEWVSDYRALAAEVRTAGVVVSELGKTLVERGEEIVVATGEAATGLLGRALVTVGVVAAAAILGLAVWKSRE